MFEALPTRIIPDSSLVGKNSPELEPTMALQLLFTLSKKTLKIEDGRESTKSFLEQLIVQSLQDR